VLIISNGALNGVGRAGTALVQSFARVFLVMLPFAWLMRDSLGAEAIFAAELAANVIGGSVAGFIGWRVLRGGQPRAAASAS
jgi:Na+-driven multidrug efflux pump